MLCVTFRFFFPHLPPRLFCYSYSFTTSSFPSSYFTSSSPPPSTPPPSTPPLPPHLPHPSLTPPLSLPPLPPPPLILLRSPSLQPLPLTTPRASFQLIKKDGSNDSGQEVNSTAKNVHIRTHSVIGLLAMCVFVFVHECVCVHVCVHTCIHVPGKIPSHISPSGAGGGVYRSSTTSKHELVNMVSISLSIHFDFISCLVKAMSNVLQWY